MYEFSYLTASLPLALLWLYFFTIRSDLRSAMLKVSSLFGIGGVLSEFVYVNDWWNPVTMFGTAVGIEDFLFGFFFSGSIAVCYEVFCNTGYQQRSHTPRWKLRFRYLGLIICTVFFGSTVVLRLHSFTATVLAFGICIFIILLHRRDLLGNSCISSLFGGSLAFVFFGLPEMLRPGWIESAWALDKLSGYFVFYVPLEDFIWFMMMGSFIGPLFKFWKNLHSVPVQESTAPAPPAHSNNPHSNNACPSQQQ